MKILSISIENFRSIQGEVQVRLQPITLLFGPNSAGKSTILQSMLMFRELLKNRNPNPHLVFGGGAHIDLGGFSALVHRHDLTRKIRIKLEFALDSDDGLDDLTGLAERMETSGLPRLSQKIAMESVSVGIGLAFDLTKQATFIDFYEIGINGEIFGAITKEYLEDRLGLALNQQHPFFQALAANEDLKSIIDLYGALSDRLRLIKQNVGEGLEVVTNDPTAGAIPEWGRLLPIWKEEETGASLVDEYAALEQILTEAFVIIGGMALNHINTAIYLGPFRTIPNRGYAAPDRIDINRWADGLAAWDTLCLKQGENGPEGSFFVKRVSDYLSSRENLDLGYSIEVQDVRILKNVDAIMGDLTRLANDEELSSAPIVEKIRRTLHALPVSRKVELYDEKRHINVEADDIGVGVSQVVPVVVGAMDPSHKIFFVEQPELHIHPRVQCSLADLFIEQINASSEKIFVLETHSEHLILRLLRRIRETTAGDAEDGFHDGQGEWLREKRRFKPEQIGVIFVESDENGMLITNIPITSEGDFAARWPHGFFGERLEEVF